VVAAGHRPAVVARVARISRQALYRPIATRPAAGPGRGRPGDDDIVEVAKAHPTDGTRMVAAIAATRLDRPVNRKRVQRVMRAHGLLQRARNGDRRRRPGFFRVTRPDGLWHMDMTKVWTAAQGWVYLHVAIDCCTREICAWTLDVRTRSDEATVCRHLEVAESTWHRWLSQYGGMKANDAKRLKELEAENARLKKLVANQALDIDMLREVAEGNF
jgi:putative transposase